MRVTEVKRVEIEIDRMKERLSMLFNVPIRNGEYQWGSEAAAIKRASLDLTKALAQMRKS